MFKRIKYGKMLVVMFLTCLIWVWADRRLEDDYTVRDTVTIKVAQSAEPDKWVSFAGSSAVLIKEVKLSGSSSKITEIRRKINERLLDLNLFFEPGQEEAMEEPGKYQLDVLSFLRKNKKINDLGLTVESCKPGAITVDVRKLVKKLLRVECVDEEGLPISGEAVDPAQIEMYVLEGEESPARVLLTRSESVQAMSVPVSKTPHIKLSDSEIRYSETTVKVTVLPGEKLAPEIISNPIVGFMFSPTTQGKYEVKIDNMADLRAPIKIRSTPAARKAYEDRRYQVYLEIDDSDINSGDTEPSKRAVIYNFPEDFVRSGDIKLDQPPAQASFRLIPITVAETVVEE